MRILFVADLHCYDVDVLEEKIALIKTLDVLCFLGDMDNWAIQYLKEKFPEADRWGLRGNHDYRYLEEDKSIIDLHLNRIEKENLSFVGFEGSHRYKQTDGALYEQNESFAIVQEKYKADVLLSHNALRGIHDKEDIAHVGFEGLKKYVDTFHPKYVFHGHEHKTRTTIYKKKFWFSKKTVIHCVYGFTIFDTNTGEIEDIYSFG